MTDFPDWQAPQAHASAIAGTGVPLLTGATLVRNQPLTTIPAASSINSGHLTVTQPGYEIFMATGTTAAATNPFSEVRLIWTDQATGTEVWRDTFICPLSSTPGGWVTVGHGPTKTNQVSVQVINLDTGQQATAQYYLLQNSRVYASDEWRWQNFADAALTVPGFTLPGLPDDESVLGVLDGITIPASSQNVYLFGMHAGLINVGYEVNTGSASNLSIRIRPKPDSSYSGHNIIYSATQPPANFQVAGPRAPLGVVVANSATTAMVLSLSAIRAD